MFSASVPVFLLSFTQAIPKHAAKFSLLNDLSTLLIIISLEFLMSM